MLRTLDIYKNIIQQYLGAFTSDLKNIQKYGNTSAASIPLALDEAVREGKIKPGDRIMTSGFGAGLTWGAALFEWGR